MLKSSRETKARNTALIYNWWLMFVRLVIPDYHAEAITSRPLLLNAVGRQTYHAGQTKITVTNTHRKSKRFRKILYNVISFLRSINDNAEQLDWWQRWRLILSRVFAHFLQGRLL
jgi:hypothetical protein